MMEYLPAIIAVIGVGITAYVNWRLGKLRANVDSKTVNNSAGDAVRDDLLALTNFYEARDKRLTEMLEKLQNRVVELLDQVDQLRTENRRLEYELKITRVELEKFERKVFYKEDSK